MKSFERIIYEARKKKPTQKGDSLFDVASDAGQGPNLRDSAARRQSTDKKLEDVRKKKYSWSSTKSSRKEKKSFQTSTRRKVFKDCCFWYQRSATEK